MNREDAKIAKNLKEKTKKLCVLGVFAVKYSCLWHNYLVSDKV